MEQDGEIVTFEPTCRVVGSGSASDGVRVDTVTLADAGDPTVTRAGDLELVLARVVGTRVEGDQTLTARGPTVPPRHRCGSPSFRRPRGARRQRRYSSRGRAPPALPRPGRRASRAGGARLDVVRAGRGSPPRRSPWRSRRGRRRPWPARASPTSPPRGRRRAPGRWRWPGAFVPGVFQSTWAVPIGVPGATPGASHTSYSALAWWPAPSSPASADEVVEGVVVHGAVLVADEAVRRDELGVEAHLRARVVGDRGEQAGELVDVEVLGLLVGVDVAVEAVALVGELLHQVVVVVAHPVADGDEVDALAPGLRDAGGDALGAGHADVGHAVGAEHHDVDAAGTVRRPGLLVAQREAVGQVGAAARVEVRRPRPGLARSRRPGSAGAAARPGRRSRRPRRCRRVAATRRAARGSPSPGRCGCPCPCCPSGPRPGSG